MSSGTATLEAAWRSEIARVLGGADPESLHWRTADGIVVEPLHTAEVEMRFAARAAGRWRISQRVDHPGLDQAHDLALADLQGGTDCLTLVAANSPSARGFGVQLESAVDMDAVLESVRLDLISLRLDPGPRGFDWAALVAEVAERRGHGLGELDLDLGIDPVSTLATAGRLPEDWATVGRHMAGRLGKLTALGFAGRAFRADGRPWSDAGASEAQELAAVLASAVLYLRTLESGGLPLVEARDALSFLLAADADLLLTVAKFRALRSLWARVEQECGLAPKPLRLHGETAWRMMSVASPETNIVRGTIACLAAVVGGTDGITVLPFTLTLGLPDAFARRLARNTHHVLAEEAHLWRVSDPAGGAGAFEALTLGLCEQSWQLFQEIEREGGIVNSLAAGHLQQRIAARRRERRARLADGRDALVGVTVFRQQDEVTSHVLMRRPPSMTAIAAGPLRVESLAAGRDAEDFEGQPGVRTQQRSQGERPRGKS